ncbi:MAG: hypothetical protein HY302_11145 [Opitutae bacterium]|nr:hypothetical protein [Opitutae bacterium]
MTHLLFALALVVLGLNLLLGFPIPGWQTSLLALAAGGLIALQHIGARRDWTFLSGFRLFAA